MTEIRKTATDLPAAWLRMAANKKMLMLMDFNVMDESVHLPEMAESFFGLTPASTLSDHACFCSCMFVLAPASVYSHPGCTRYAVRRSTSPEDCDLALGVDCEPYRTGDTEAS